MDDELVQRWRSGDEPAEAAVREHIRSVAIRVLSHACLHQALGLKYSEDLRDPEHRRQVCDDVAQLLMERQAGGAARIEAAAVVSSVEAAVDRLQMLPGRSGDGHLPSRILVALAVAPEGLGTTMMDALDRHLADCPVCRSDLSTAIQISRGLAAHPVVHRHAQADSQARTGGSTVPDRPKVAFRGASVVKSPRRLLSVWPLVGVAGIAGWLVFSRMGSSGPGELEGVALLADLSPPPVARLSDLPAETQLALRDLSMGDCARAATRLRDIREAFPDEARLYLLEGASFVCNGDGRRALVTFDALDRAVEDRGLKRPRQLPWYRAQAQILEGDLEAALESLGEVDRVDSRHRGAARKLARKIETTSIQ